MSTYEDLLQQYQKAQQELGEAEVHHDTVNQRHSFRSGALIYQRPHHPKVQQAWERLQKARECEAELLRQLREWRA